MTISIVSVLTLILLEIILSIDNLIFIATVSEKMNGRFKEPIKIFGLTIELFSRAVTVVRITGLSMAFLMRGIFVFSIDWILKLKTAFLTIGSYEITYKELVFILGGLLLIYKSGMEVKKIISCKDDDDQQKSDVDSHDKNIKSNTRSDIAAFFISICQILLIDLIFSIDSVLIAIALVPDVKIIMLTVFISMVTLFFSLNKLSYVMKKYQNLKLLAMLFIIGVGLIFISSGFELYINKNYLNAAFVFSLIFAICDILRMKNKEKKNLE